MKMILHVVLGLFLSTFTKSAPVGSVVDDQAQQYLEMFGYLPKSDPLVSNLRTSEQFTDAIIKLQGYANIPRTGRLDSATKTLLKQPRCGMTDVSIGGTGGRNRFKRFAVNGLRWYRNDITWSLRSAAIGLDKGGIRLELTQAFLLWERHSNLRFTETNSDQADILISFHRRHHGDGYPFDGRGQILAHAFFPGPDNGGDVHFDQEELWWLQTDPNKQEGTSLFAVAAHEFGHSLGLQHSSDQSALMYPWYQELITNYDLPPDDRYGIQQMYGSPKEKMWAPLPKITTTTTTTTRPWRTYPSREPPRRPYYPVTTNRPRTKPPKTCDTSYDAINMIRGELFIFKGQYFWRIGKGGLSNNYPIEISRMFGFLEGIDHVDAVYETLDDRIVFFVGKQYYVSYATILKRGYPKPLTNLGFPEHVDKIDAAFIWGYNNRTFFFSGSNYWRLDVTTNRVEPDYPREISTWVGIGHSVDAAFQWTNGKTYFFKDKKYWEFDDGKMRVAHEKPKISAEFWMRCPKFETTNEIDDENDPKTSLIVSDNSGTSNIYDNRSPLIFYTLIIIIFFSSFFSFQIY